MFQLSQGSMDQITDMLNWNVDVAAEKKMNSYGKDECTTCWGGSCANNITG